MRMAASGAWPGRLPAQAGPVRAQANINPHAVRLSTTPALSLIYEADAAVSRIRLCYRRMLDKQASRGQFYQSLFEGRGAFLRGFDLR